MVAVISKTDILIIYGPESDIPDGAEDVEAGEEDAVEGLVTRPPVEHVGAVFGHSVDYGFVDAPEDEVIQAEGEGASVPEHHSPQVAESRHRIVSKSSSLVAFLAHEAEANVRLLDHVDVVGAIAYGCCDALVRVVFHEADDFGFLGGGGAEDDGRFSREEQLCHLLMDKLVVKNHGNSHTRNDNLMLFVHLSSSVHELDLLVDGEGV